MRYPHLMKMPEVFIDSMKVLIRRYEQAIEEGISKDQLERMLGAACLLCNPIGSTITQRSIYHENDGRKFDKACKQLGCPWWVISGKSCTPDDVYTTCYNTDDADTMRKRVRQIRRWIKIYEDYVAKKELAI